MAEEAEAALADAGVGFGATAVTVEEEAVAAERVVD